MSCDIKNQGGTKNRRKMMCDCATTDEKERTARLQLCHVPDSPGALEVDFTTNQGMTIQKWNYEEFSNIESIKEFLGKMLTKSKSCCGDNQNSNYDANAVFALQSIAEIHHIQQDNENAIYYYEEALTIAKTAFGLFHQEVANILNRLGSILQEEGDHDSALMTYNEALEVQREILDGSDNLQLAETLNSIGQLLKFRGDYCNSLLHACEAHEIQHISLGRVHPKTCSTLLLIATIHLDLCNFQEALVALNEVLHVQRLLYGDSHLEVASTLDLIGLALMRMEQQELALRNLHTSLNIRRTVLSNGLNNTAQQCFTQYQDIANVLYKIGSIYFCMGEERMALYHYCESLRIGQAILGHDHEQVVETVLRIGHVHETNGKFDDAIQYYTEAYEIQCRSYHDNNKNKDHHHATVAVAATLQKIGNLYMQKGQTNQMVTAFSNAARLLHTVGISFDEEYVTAHGFDLYGISKTHPECACAA